MTSDTLTVCLSVASLALSLFVLWRQRQAAGRANLVTEDGGPGLVEMVNLGHGAASKVEAVVVFDEMRNESTSVAYMPPGQASALAFDRPLGGDSGVLRVTWRDNHLRRQSADLPLPTSRPRRVSSPPTSNRNTLDAAIRSAAREEAQALFDRTPPRDPGRRGARRT